MNKSARLDDSYRNAKQKEEILLSKPSFHRAVLTFRNKWRIPTNGLKKDELENWQIWFIRSRKSYQVTTHDIKVEKERQKRINHSSNELIRGFDRLIDEYLDTSSLDGERVFKNDIGKILRKQGLNPRWYQYVERYLLLNKKIKVPSGMEFRIEVDDTSGQEIIMLKITEEIRKPDFIAVWNMVEKYQAKLPYYKRKKIQPRRVFKRNKKVAEMKEAEQSVEDIIEYLDKKYPKKVNDVYMKEDVLKMISEHKKAISEKS